MPGVSPALPPGVVARKLVLTFAGMVALAAGITLVFESMRSVMDVGGSCASGGPYQVRQECPDGTWLMFVGILAGLIGTGLVVAGGFRGGPKLWTLAWPALFLSLGWNFFEYGIDPPPPNEGLVWGWLICAVVFFVMGAIPLLFVVVSFRSILWGRGTATAPAPASTAPTTPASFDDLVDDLERLATMHRDGQLTDAEYSRAKDARLDAEGGA